MTEDDLTLGGRHTVGHEGHVSETCALETCVLSLTDVTPINCIEREKKRNEATSTLRKKVNLNSDVDTGSLCPGTRSSPGRSCPFCCHNVLVPLAARMHTPQTGLGFKQETRISHSSGGKSKVMVLADSVSDEGGSPLWFIDGHLLPRSPMLEASQALPGVSCIGH